MKIVFNEEFKNSDYASDNAAAPGRIEAAMSAFSDSARYQIVPAPPATEDDILRAHSARRLLEVKNNPPLYKMSMLAAGAAISAAELSFYSNEPVFACVRPPGHHAAADASWGYCSFCNLSVALLKLKSAGSINNAIVLDFDAHTGDGTIDTLKPWPEVIIINPYADNNKNYIKEVTNRLGAVEHADIIAVSAGFDAYIHDVGKKLETFDFYQIGHFLKRTAKRMGHNKRFAVLEGGYYLADLGKNIQAFCDGFA